MIYSLRMQNFKCFRDQVIQFGRLTLLTGLNGMGKSSVIQALLLLRQSARYGQMGQLILNGDFVSLGAAVDVLYEGAQSDLITIELDMEAETAGPDPDEFSRYRKRFVWEFLLDRETDVLHSTKGQGYDFQAFELSRTSLLGNPFQYLNAERIGPRTSFDTAEFEVRQNHQIGIRGEFATHFLAIYGNSDIPNPALAHPDAMSLSLKNQVEAWLGEITPGARINLTSVPEMDLVGLRFSFVNGRQESNSYRATNVGFGLTYTLPILVATLAAPPDALLVIENPEAHLHPRGQAMIGTLLARAAQCGVQIVIETHSDHVLNGVRLAVHGGGQPSLLDPENVRMHFFQRAMQNDVMTHTVTSPSIDRDGRIDRWPAGFFDEWDKSLEALLEPRSE